MRGATGFEVVVPAHARRTFYETFNDPNTGLRPGKGAPNSWALTEKGRRIAGAMRVGRRDEILSCAWRRSA